MERWKDPRSLTRRKFTSSFPADPAINPNDQLVSSRARFCETRDSPCGSMRRGDAALSQRSGGAGSAVRTKATTLRDVGSKRNYWSPGNFRDRSTSFRLEGLGQRLLDIPCVHQGEHTDVRGEDSSARTRPLLLGCKGLYIKRNHA